MILLLCILPPATNKDKSTSVNPQHLTEGEGDIMLISDLWGRCRCCWEKLPKQSSVTNVLLARIIVACGAVNQVLENLFTTHTCKQTKVN